MTVVDVASLLAPYAALQHLECDGLTRVSSQVLRKGGVPHTTWCGQIVYLPTGYGFAEHRWIELPAGRRIDFRARRWLGEREDVPHGVFVPADFPAVQYSGEPWDVDPLPEFVFQALLVPIPQDLLARHG